MQIHVCPKTSWQCLDTFSFEINQQVHQHDTDSWVFPTNHSFLSGHLSCAEYASTITDSVIVPAVMAATLSAHQSEQQTKEELARCSALTPYWQLSAMGLSTVNHGTSLRAPLL